MKTEEARALLNAAILKLGEHAYRNGVSILEMNDEALDEVNSGIVTAGLVHFSQASIRQAVKGGQIGGRFEFSPPNDMDVKSIVETFSPVIKKFRKVGILLVCDLNHRTLRLPEMEGPLEIFSICGTWRFSDALIDVTVENVDKEDADRE